jgi:hypothetical protein
VLHVRPYFCAGADVIRKWLAEIINRPPVKGFWSANASRSMGMRADGSEFSMELPITRVRLRRAAGVYEVLA